MPAAGTTDVRVDLPSGGSLKAVVAEPRGGGPHPGVVVLHEATGINDDLRRICGRFAERGWLALAPDLFSGPGGPLCLARVLLDGMVRGAGDETLAQIEAARATLAARPDVDASRLTVAGFCMGGGFALVFATRNTVRAAAVQYGPVPKKEEELEGVCPVVASYGAADRVLKNEPDRLRRHLEALDVPHDIKTYEGVGHSFMSRDNAPGWMLRIPTPMRVGYDENAAEDAWRRIFDFFDTHAGAAAPEERAR